MKLRSHSFFLNNYSNNICSSEHKKGICIKSNSLRTSVVSERLQKFIQSKLRGLGYDGYRNCEEYLAELNKRINNKERPMIKRSAVSDVQSEQSFDTPTSVSTKEIAPLLPGGIPPPPPMAGIADFRPTFRSIAMYAPVDQHVQKSTEEIRKMITSLACCDGRPQLNIAVMMTEMMEKFVIKNINKLIQNDAGIISEIQPILGGKELAPCDINNISKIFTESDQSIKSINYIKSESGRHYFSISLHAGGNRKLSINSEIPFKACVDKN